MDSPTPEQALSLVSEMGPEGIAAGATGGLRALGPERTAAYLMALADAATGECPCQTCQTISTVFTGAMNGG
jgi:hypothetical protein